MRTKRQGLIVWLQHRKYIKQIRRFGHVIYMSKKMSYVVLYVNQSDIDDIERKLNRFPFVTKTARSHKPLIKTEFERRKAEFEKKDSLPF